MSQILRQSTQIIVVIGPFVDVGDGFTPETGVTLSGADEAEILKSGTTTTTDISGATWAAITGCDGWYGLTLTTSHTDTVGSLTVMVHDDSVCLPVFARFQVIEEAVYDDLYAASAPGIPTAAEVVNEWESQSQADPTGFHVNVLEIGGTAQTANDNGADINAILDDTDLIDDATSGLAKIATDVAAVLVDTAVIGATGAGLTSLATAAELAKVPKSDSNVTWNATAAAQIQSEANDALVAQKLDHLVAVAESDDPADNSIIAKLAASDGDWSGFAASTDALEALRDHIADGANLTEAGGTGDHLTAINLPDQTMNITGDITGNLSGSVGSVTGNVGGNVAGSVGSVTGNVGGNVAGSVGSVTGNVGGNVTGSVGSLATQAKADVNAEVDGAIETYHLDHLLAATYDPASKPGASDALLNELVENDGGVARYTANALEQGPTIAAATTAAAVWDKLQADHVAAGSFGEIATEIASVLDDTGSAGVVVAAGSKTGYALAATGLDSVVGTEPTAAPAFSASIVSILSWLLAMNRNKRSNDGATETLYKDDGTTTMSTATITVAGGTVTKGEFS